MVLFYFNSMDNKITIISDDLSNIKLALNFKEFGSVVKAKAYTITDKNELILYWTETARGSLPLVHPLEGLDIEPLLVKHFSLYEPTSKPYDGDGSIEKAYLLTTDGWRKEYGHLDQFYISLIFKPTWVFYGK